jgi:23S rRNA (guanosine2251-2'-O)-methyltransferase
MEVSRKVVRQKRNNRPQQERKRRPPAMDSETTIIYGVMPVFETLRAAPGRFSKILLSDERGDKKTTELAALARQSGVPVNRVSRADIGELVPEGVNHQGVAAFVKAGEYCTPEALIEKAIAQPDSLLLVLDSIEDPRNFGAILRSAECAGVCGVFIPERRAVGLTDTAVKTSAGAAELVDVAKVGNINKLIDELKKNDIWVVGSSGAASMSYHEWDFTQRTAVVLGGEGKGVRRLTAEKCDQLVKIPMYGKIESLNVSVAAGVLLFEATRQKEKKRS